MPENLYQHNTEIIKGFFRRPIVLITSIVYLVTIVASCFLDIIMSFNPEVREMLNNIIAMYLPENIAVTTSVSADVNIPVVSILFALAFLLFYIFSRRPDGRLNGAATLLKVISIINLVAICIIIGVFLIVSSFLLMLAPDPQFVLLFILILAALVALLLVEAISQVLFANSIKKSINGIYLYKNGAQTFAVVQFIKVAVYALLAALFCFVYNAVASMPYYYYPIVPEPFLFTAIGVVISIPSTLLIGILAIKYSSYITDMSQGFVPPVQQQTVYQPVYQNPEPSQPNPYEPQQYAQPTAQYEPQPQAVFCTNCGKQLNPDDYFCNQCGTPVRK